MDFNNGVILTSTSFNNNIIDTNVRIDTDMMASPKMSVIYLNDYISFVKTNKNSSGKLLNYYRVAVNIETGQETKLYDFNPILSDFPLSDPNLNYIYYYEMNGSKNFICYSLDTGEKFVLYNNG